MATYFHNNSEIQGGSADGLQTLIFMNPSGYINYSDTPQPPPHAGNLVFLNSAATLAGNGNTSIQQQHNLSHAPPQFVGVPLSAEQSVQAHHDISALHGFPPRMQYNMWNAADPNSAAREATRATQGLSLSLHAQGSGEDARVSAGGSCSSASNNGVSGIQSVLLSSKYLKATQELLDEVVNVNGGIKVESVKKSFEKNKVVGESSTAVSGDGGSVGGDGSGKRSTELSTTERQEVQMKKAKLINMLDEVEQRYRQYHNQMQMVISSFEQVAGIGSARTYTALALQTISKQFRCLKDAITGQIRAANKSLGEDDSFGGKIEGSRLKYVDHHLRQQRAIQQLGMMHHNAWRPQRGLPERSVSVLRAWLFAPTAFNPIIPSSSSSSSSLKSHKFIKTRTKLTQFNNNAISISSDPFLLNLAETLEDSIPTPQPLQNLREASSESLLSTPWPSRRDEPFRFTDLSFLRSSHILPAPIPTTTTTTVTPPFSDDDDQFPCHISFIDGHFINSMSKNLEFPDGVYVGSLLNLSGKVAERVLELVSGLDGGDLFWSINGMAAPDLMVVYVPEGVRVENPVHLGYLSLLGSKDGSKDLYISNPRVLVVVEKGGEVDIVEEFSNDEENENENEFYWSNAVLEVVIGEGGKVRHSYIQTQSLLAAHIKWTSVRQESSSTYELTEVSTGGKLGRHNLHIKQLGPDTVTELSTLHLSVGNQTQDLHSSLVLDHPRGFSRQLHKCIVTHSQGQAVFDGNVKVNRYAQQTDAGQLTRSLLLEPRATVNVKPNLQIIADDVKCSHGAAISDLEQSQLLYFQARGIDSATARRVLIFAFGGEVIDKFPYSSVRDRVRSQIKSLLDPSPKLAPL